MRQGWRMRVGSLGLATAVALLTALGNAWAYPGMASPEQEPPATARGIAPEDALAVPSGPLFLVPSDLSEAELGGAIPIHDYPEGRLMVIRQPSTLPAAILNRLTSIDTSATLTYRGWKGSLPSLSIAALSALPDGYYLMSLVGPEDSTWGHQLALFGVSVVDEAWPYGLVVHADGTQLLGAASSLATSYGYSVIRGIVPVPMETRLSGELLRVVNGEQKLQDIRGLRENAKRQVVVRLFYFNDPSNGTRPLDHRAEKLAEVRKYARIPGSDLAYGYDDAVLVGGAEDLRRILREVPSVSYVEALHEPQMDDHAQVYYPIAMAVAPPLYTVKPIVPEKAVVPSVMPEEEIPDWVNGKDKPGPESDVVPGEAVVQNWVGQESMPSPIANFEGLGTGLSGFSMTGAPPDTEGDVGPNHYVQWVNSMFAIFDKNGTKLYGPANGNTLFSSLGGRCASDNDGDPLVMYDRIADRWFMSQFSVSGSPYYQCVAVSQTNNPVTTAWNLYAYDYGTNMNDYGKSGVWPDGYYIMYHMFARGRTWAGTEVCAFDRVKMLAGQVASQQCFGPNASYGGLLPTHFQGSTLPPSGSPNYFVAYGSNRLFFWPFHVDWTTPSSSTFPFNSPTTLTVASFTEPCGGSGGTCVPQKGTSTQLDTLGDRLMWRMNYRNFGTYESLVFNHSITAGAGTGIRWYEIRNPSTTPTIYQQGTFAPSDATWRWMGSVNMDKNGDIAAGYSASSSTMNPSLWYTGRLVTDTLGTFGQGEATLYSGSGSQTGTLTRWGDYSTMSLDPNDDCTFWFTSEYLSSDGTFNWRTRICSFKFASCTSCTAPGAPTLTSATADCSGVALVWTPGTGTTLSYNVYRGTTSGGPYSKLGGMPVTTTSYTDATASAGTAYYYVVTGACDTSGLSESSNSNQLSATGSGVPEAPSGVTATPSCSDVSISWSPVAGATSYTVLRGSVCGTPVTTFTNKTSPFSDTSAVAGTAYQYWVVAVNACGSSANSSCASATRPACVPNIVYNANGSWTQVTGMGNDDAVQDPGESWDVTVTLANTGTAPATNVVASLSATGAAFCTGTASFGNIGIGSTGTGTFRFTVDSAFTCGNDLSFNVVGKASDEGSYADESGAFTKGVGATSPATPETATAADFKATKNTTATATLSPAFTAPGVSASAAVATYTATSQFNKINSALLRCVGTGNTIALSLPTGNNVAVNTTVTAFYQSNGPGTYRMEWTIGNQNVDLASLSMTVTPTGTAVCNVWTGTNCATPGEVSPGGTSATALTWAADKNTLTWQAPAEAVKGYRLYRGTPADLPNLLTSATDSCTRADQTGLSFDLNGVNDTPAAGTFIWFLVTGYNGPWEGSAGNATQGARVIDSSGVCTP